MLFDGNDEIDSNEMFLIGKTPYSDDQLILLKSVFKCLYSRNHLLVILNQGHFNGDSEQFKLENSYEELGGRILAI